MQKTKSVFRTNVIYGLIVLIPAAIIVLLLAKIVEFLELIAGALHLQSAASVIGAVILALLLLLLICFLAGALVRTRLGAWSFERFESSILKQIPGFEIISNALKGFAEKKSAYRAALIRLYGPGTGVFGFIMEKNDNGSVTVFVPSVPTLTLGNLHIVDCERVTMLEAGSIEITNCISQWGIGSPKILGSTRL